MNAVEMGAAPRANGEAVRMLLKYLELARAGTLLRVGVIAETDGQWTSEFSSSDDQRVDGAMLIELGIRRLGFINHKLRP